LRRALDSRKGVRKKSKMKSPFLLLPFVVLSAVAASAEETSGSTAAPPAPSAIEARVEQVSKMTVPKGAASRTQTRFLKVFLSNASHDEVSLKIKYAFFGHGVKDHDDFVVTEGEKDATVKPAGITEEDTPSATATETRAIKKTPASGTVIVGYGVQVFLGDKMVAESYEPSSLKSQMGKAPPAPKGPPAAKPTAKATPAKG